MNWLLAGTATAMRPLATGEGEIYAFTCLTVRVGGSTMLLGLLLAVLAGPT